jgi:NADH:ubiquinone oxidoreductase subunit 6 (subunit J)
MILAAFFVIAPRNPIHSVGALIFIVLNFVFLLINLEAEYLALIFVAVYLGAVSVLFLFIVMMLNIKLFNQFDFLFFITKKAIIPIAAAPKAM